MLYSGLLILLLSNKESGSFIAPVLRTPRTGKPWFRGTVQQREAVDFREYHAPWLAVLNFCPTCCRDWFTHIAYKMSKSERSSFCSYCTTVIVLIAVIEAFIESKNFGRPLVRLLLCSELLNCNLDHCTPRTLCNLAILLPLCHDRSIRYLPRLGLSSADILSNMS